MSDGSFAFVSLKAFGDLVIARWALQRLTPSASIRVRLLLGAHLVQLNTALGDRPGTLVIEHGGTSVPPFFEMRQCGPGPALRSGLVLRSAIGRACLPDETTLVFDRIGVRERLLAIGRHHTALPSTSSNIYLAYEEFLRPFGLVNEPTSLVITTADEPSASYVGIFPDSRIGNKRIPGTAVTALARLCIDSGVPYRIFLLEGEPSDLSSSTMNVTKVPRQFSLMANAVRAARVVISADSMPAHMAEYFGVPVFVMSPSPNAYWLPKSCIDSGRWSLFSDPVATTEGLARFVVDR